MSDSLAIALVRIAVDERQFAGAQLTRPMPVDRFARQVA
jgi:hypothetical protein